VQARLDLMGKYSHTVTSAKGTTPLAFFSSSNKASEGSLSTEME